MQMDELLSEYSCVKQRVCVNWEGPLKSLWNAFISNIFYSLLHTYARTTTLPQEVVHPRNFTLEFYNLKGENSIMFSIPNEGKGLSLVANFGDHNYDVNNQATTVQ